MISIFAPRTLLIIRCFLFFPVLFFIYIGEISAFSIWKFQENCDGDCQPYAKLVEHEIRRLGIRVDELKSITFPIPIVRNQKIHVIDGIEKCRSLYRYFRFIGDSTKISYTKYYFEKNRELPRKKTQRISILNSTGDLEDFSEIEYKNLNEIRHRKTCHKITKDGNFVSKPEKKFGIKICENQDRVFEYAVFYDEDSFFPRTRLIPLDLSAVIFGPDLL